MSMLGDFLPKAGESISSTATSIGNSISDAAGSATKFITGGTSNFNLANMTTKIGESASKMLGSFGSLMGFKNVAANLPSADLASLLKQQGIGVGAGQTLLNANEAAFVRESNNDVVVVLESTISSEYIKFRVSPRISESRSAQYSEVNLIHHPGSILKYERTASRSWNVSAKLVSRNQQEASENQNILNMLRGWVMPFYGAGTEQNDPDKLGAPPPVLLFSGFGENNIGKIPVVLESYSTDWPNDCDYIPTMTGDPFPVVMDITVNLKESYSPAEYSNFNLFAYKSGWLSEAFKGNQVAFSEFSMANEIVPTNEPAILGQTKAITGTPTANALSGLVSGNVPLPSDPSSAVSAFGAAKQNFTKIGSFASSSDTTEASPAASEESSGSAFGAARQNFTNIGSY